MIICYTLGVLNSPIVRSKILLTAGSDSGQVNLADLNSDEDQASKKIRLCIEARSKASKASRIIDARSVWDHS